MLWPMFIGDCWTSRRDVLIFLAQQEFRGAPDLREVDESFLGLDQAVFVHLPEVNKQSPP